MTTPQRNSVWLFDDFQPGQLLGSRSETVGDELLQHLRQVYGTDGNRPLSRPEAATLAMVVMMRSYLGIVTPRPPGNIHARQQFQLAALPEPGESLRVELHCQSKEMRRDRRYVNFQAVGTGRSGRAIFNGILTLIWAA